VTIVVLDGRQRFGRIRFADEHMPAVWLWSVTIHLPDGLFMGSAHDIDTAKAEFKAAWTALKARIPPEQLAAAYRTMNIRDDDAAPDLQIFCSDIAAALQRGRRDACRCPVQRAKPGRQRTRFSFPPALDL
jgi:hypothetical protein